jgi:hypothetical protein
VAVLVIGTDGFGEDAHILGRPGHRRRLKALSRLHGGRTWVKPDFLDIASEVPNSVVSQWPEIPAAMKSYGKVIYAATAVRSADDGRRVADLLDLFFDEHGTPLTGKAKEEWNRRRQEIAGAIFPSVAENEVWSYCANGASWCWRGHRARGRRGSLGGWQSGSVRRRESSSIRRVPMRTSWSVSSHGLQETGSHSKCDRATSFAQMKRPITASTCS